MGRDDDLDALEKELRAPVLSGTPYIERPDTMDLKPGMLCWLQGSRVCGADCVAYNAEEFAGNDYIQGPDKCLVLCHMKSSAVATQAVVAVAKKSRADTKKTAAGGGMPAPPDPFGGKR